MKASRLLFPVRHVSIRVPWHDSRWDARVCLAPGNNSACLKLPRIAENKDETSEARVAGRSFKELQPQQVPPCLTERAAFMSPHSFVRGCLDLTRFGGHPKCGALPRRGCLDGEARAAKKAFVHTGVQG